MFALLYYDFPFSSKLQMEMIAWDKLNGHKSPTSHMLECARAYVEVIVYWLNNTHDLGNILWFGLERGIPIFPEEGCFGTGDCIIVGTSGCAVIDFKFGKGHKVQADTLQLKAYAAGIARHLIDIPADYKFITVIFQPRVQPGALEYTWTLPEMNQFLGEIWKSIQQSKEEGLSPVEGRHCYWCPARKPKDPAQMCGAIKEKPMKLVAEDFAGFMSAMQSPVDYVGAPNRKRDEAIMKLIALKPMIDDVVKNGLEEFMMRLDDGEVIPGAVITTTFGNRSYNGTEAEIFELLRTKFPMVTEPSTVVPSKPKLKSITEIEREYKIDLTSICIKKGTKTVDILDDKMRTVLGEMANYGKMLNNGQGQGE